MNRACTGRRPLAVAAALCAALAMRAEGQACADSAGAFRRIIAEFQSRQRNVGLAAAVLADGRLVFAEGFGWADPESRVAATADTRFGVASVTKAFTGVALLTLVQAGRIDLDAEIQRYVPEFPRHPQGPVTLRELAAHLGGIRHWGPERNAALYARHFDDVFDILPLFRDSAFALPPLTRYSYSSYGYNLLAMAMQRATGVPFQRYLEEAVLRPLGLRSVAFDRPGLDGPRRPARYSWYDLTDFHALDSAPVRVPDWDYSHNTAGGNLVATVGDLVRFGRALRRPGFLTDSTLALLWRRPVIGGSESPMSFGWFVRDDPARLGIGGSNAGLQAGVSVWRDQDLAVAVLANTWGVGSRSGELMDDAPGGLLGKLAAVCRGQ
jgi:serine beta-lactamase-like protein LACTB